MARESAVPPLRQHHDPKLANHLPLDNAKGSVDGPLPPTNLESDNLAHNPTDVMVGNPKICVFLDLPTEVQTMILRLCVPSVVGFPPLDDAASTDKPVVRKDGLVQENNPELMDMAAMRVCRKFNDVCKDVLLRESSFCLCVNSDGIKCQEDLVYGGWPLCVGVLSRPTQEQYPLLCGRPKLKAGKFPGSKRHVPWDIFKRFGHIKLDIRADYDFPQRPKIDAQVRQLENITTLLRLRQKEWSKEQDGGGLGAAPVNGLDVEIVLRGRSSMDWNTRHFYKFLMDLIIPLQGRLRRIPSVTFNVASNCYPEAGEGAWVAHNKSHTVGTIIRKAEEEIKGHDVAWSREFGQEYGRKLRHSLFNGL